MIVKACVRFYAKDNDTMWEIPCHRHADAFYILSQFCETNVINKRKTEQGFLTENDIFLNRYEAMDEAIRCKQLSPEDKERCAELYSEDLW